MVPDADLEKGRCQQKSQVLSNLIKVSRVKHITFRVKHWFKGKSLVGFLGAILPFVLIDIFPTLAPHHYN